MHPAFIHISTQHIDSLDIDLIQYEHKVTGARHLHLASKDNNNVFLVGFLTVPQDSTGVAHILEHTVLCGSQRYPIRDPFFKMIRRSLNTFMNAFTAADWTAYPFASQNPKDFYNLMDVYLDAAFFPLIEDMDFSQEGHRLELENPADLNSKLVYKGIVFNEMKGAMSSPTSRLQEVLQSHLFPTVTYHYNSGGDPAAITDLTYAQLQAFHARHYHPSNALFMTYGDLPPAEHQKMFEEKVLSRFQRQEMNLRVPDEKRYTAPITVQATYPLPETDAGEEKTHIVMGWLFGRITDALELLRTQILAAVLLDNSSSPLRHALETSSLGCAPSPFCGLDSNTREATFCCGLEGSEPQRQEEVRELILNVLREVAENGVPQAQIDAVLHQFELSQREVNGDGYPYGLSLILQALTPVLHGGDPFTALDMDSLLQQLRDEVCDPQFIPNLIRRWLLDNPHSVLVTMQPDTQLAAQENATEEQKLANIAQTLDVAARQQLVEQATILQQRQAEEQDPAILPKVTLADVPTHLSFPEATCCTEQQTPLHYFEQGTNGLVYQQLVINPPVFSAAQWEILPILNLTFAETGAGDRDYLQIQAQKAAVTGGISARAVLRGGLHDVRQTFMAYSIAGKALARNHAELTDLTAELLQSARFDEADRIRELVSQYRLMREDGIARNGHHHAMSVASKRLSPFAQLTQAWDGIEGIRALRQLEKQIEQTHGMAQLASDLAQMRAALAAAPRELVVVGEKPLQAEITQTFGARFAQPTYSAQWALLPAFEAELVREGWAINAPVFYCAKAYATVAPGHADAAALQVLGPYLQNGYLHRVIREQGGAYGGGAGYAGDTGGFRFFSYRDPRSQATLDDFDRSLEWLQGAHPERELEEAILSVIAAIDRPGSPAGDAISTYYANLFERTPEQRNAFRQQVLKVTLADLQQVAQTYLHPEKAHIAVLGPMEGIQQIVGLTLRTL